MRFRTVQIVCALACVAQCKVWKYNLTISQVWEAPDGHGRPMFAINDQSPGPVLTVKEGEEMEVFVVNNLLTEATMHWHGIYQIDHPWNDGVPGVTQYSIQPRDNYTHRFTVQNQYGSYFYHGHFGPAFADGQRGPVWVIPADWRPRPYDLISEDKKDLKAMRKAEESPHHIVVSDWNSEGMEILLMQYRDSGFPPWCSSSLVFNGRGRTYCHSKKSIAENGGPPLRNEMGCMIDSPFYKYTNPVPCEATDSPLEVIEVEGGSWAFINFIHSGAHHELGISIDEHEVWVVAADGEFVRPQHVHRANINLGERISLLVHLNKEPKDYAIRLNSLRVEQVIEGIGILRYKQKGASSNKDGSSVPSTKPWVHLNGTLIPKGGVYMDENSLRPFPDRPPPQYSNTTLRFTVNMTTDSTWVLNSSPHQGFRQQLPPIMWNDMSRGDTSYGSTGRMKNGSVVDIIFENADENTSMHPFHKHNHKAFVIGSGTGGFPFDSVADALDGGYQDFFNLVDPPIRDGCRLLAGKDAWTVIRYEISFPAVSMLHCHMIHHFASGQQVILLEGLDAMPEIPASVRNRVHADFIPPVRYGPLD